MSRLCISPYKLYFHVMLLYISGQSLFHVLTSEVVSIQALQDIADVSVKIMKSVDKSVVLTEKKKHVHEDDEDDDDEEDR
jgi:hypothetical protein